MNIEKWIEHEIGEDLHKQISSLRNECFPEAAVNRSYFKQLPHFRFLAFEDGSLVGHMGVDHRVISISNQPYQIFGIIDLCVSPHRRSKAIARKILRTLHGLAHESEIEFIVLFAKDKRLYLINDFTVIPAKVSWLRIEDHNHHGIGSEHIEDEIMIKQVGKRGWPEGEIDLLGYLF